MSDSSKTNSSPVAVTLTVAVTLIAPETNVALPVCVTEAVLVTVALRSLTICPPQVAVDVAFICDVPAAVNPPIAANPEAPADIAPETRIFCADVELLALPYITIGNESSPYSCEPYVLVPYEYAVAFTVDTSETNC